MGARGRLLIALKVSLFTSIGTLLLLAGAERSNLELGILLVGPAILLGGLVINILLSMIFVKEKIFGKLLYAIISAGLWIILFNGIGLVFKSLKVIY